MLPRLQVRRRDVQNPVESSRSHQRGILLVAQLPSVLSSRRGGGGERGRKTYDHVRTVRRREDNHPVQFLDTVHLGQEGHEHPVADGSAAVVAAAGGGERIDFVLRGEGESQFKEERGEEKETDEEDDRRSGGAGFAEDFADGLFRLADILVEDLR